MGCFHKVLPNVKSAYVTFQNFTPDLQKFYTDISAVSATLSNSADDDIGAEDSGVGGFGYDKETSDQGRWAEQRRHQERNRNLTTRFSRRPQ